MQNPSEERIANEGEDVKNFRLADNKPFKEYGSHMLNDRAKMVHRSTEPDGTNEQISGCPHIPTFKK